MFQNNNRFVVFPNGTLRIADAKPVDAGFYKCQAINEVDVISKTVLITISGQFSHKTSQYSLYFKLIISQL